MEGNTYAHLPLYQQFDLLLKEFEHKTEKVAVINQKLFHNIPFHYGFKMNMEGIVYDIAKRAIVKPTLNKTGYYAVTVRRNGSGRRSITAHVHRLLALTFLTPENIDHVDFLQVNHIDGNKTNNALSNLEWVTQQRNCQHAYETGLRVDNNEVTLTCRESGREYRMYSQAAAARFLGVTPAAVCYWLKKAKETVYKGFNVQVKKVHPPVMVE